MGFPLLPFGKTGDYYRWVAGRFGRDLLKIAGGKATVSGLEQLDPAKSYIFIGNHQSYADIFIILASLDKLHMKVLFMLKRELFNIPLFGMVARQMGLVPVERGESRQALKAMMDAMKTIKDGRSLVIFPEGTRTKDGNLQPFKRGAFLLAERTGLEIVPFVITGTAQVMPRKNLPLTPGACNITFLKPVSPAEVGKELSNVVEQMITEQYALDKAIMDEKWATKA
ncbi:MAG: 1-acyl-sn-glycerol-3-phosphate acyltransferase [Deferribacteraceae bacterium]|nr:1-acyl-sn-glycerol-3-phosphate acyltransferase [Deferribacteraceae bacterium]